MTLIKEWEKLSPEEQARIKKEALDLIGKPLPDFKKLAGLEEPKITYSFAVPPETTPIPLFTTVRKEDLQKGFKEMQKLIEQIFQFRPSPFQQMLASMPRSPDPVFHWWDEEPEDLDNLYPDVKPERETMSVKAHIVLDTDEIRLVPEPKYNSKLQRMLKQIPLHERSWDRQRRVWKIEKSEANLNLCKAIIRQTYGYQAQMFSVEGDIHATNSTAVDVTSKYGILQVAPEASPAEIKKAYYRIAKKLHPDVSDADKEFFELATKAYNTLKDPLKRKKYDLARKLMVSRLERDTGLKLTSKDQRI